ncbi:MAG TPA: hypothetical protein PKD55_04720 [Bellilinea sp.]|nr:hypothetical protein [Bellilinea sp.]
MRRLVSIPVLVIAVIAQITIFSRLKIMGGTADVVLLVLIAWAMQEQSEGVLVWGALGGSFVTMASSMPLYFPFFGYLGIIAIVWFLRRQVWQSPIIAMVFVTFISTFLFHLASILVLKITDVDIPIVFSITHVTIPSVILNLILAIPIYTMMRDLSIFLYPPEVA